MTTAGEARMYLQGEVEHGFEEAERYLKTFSSEASKTLKGVAQGIYQLARNLRRNKMISKEIAANLQICYNDLIELSHEAGKKASSQLSPAEKEAAKRVLVEQLKRTRKKMRLVESLLIRLEKEPQKQSNQLRA